MEYKYIVNRPYWNSNSHPESGELRHEFFSNHYAYVWYERELTKEEIKEYDIIPIYIIEGLIGKSFKSNGFTIELLSLDRYYCTARYTSKEENITGTDSFHVNDILDMLE